MKVLGLDPGSRLLGYAVIEAQASAAVRVASGTLKLDPRAPLADRLAEAHLFVRRLIIEQRPDQVAIEECFVAQGVKAALVLGQVRGVLMLAATLEAAPLLEFAPRAIKLAAVGNGGASKEQVQYMVPKLIRGCAETLSPDEADALAIAWCGCQHARNPLHRLVVPPQATQSRSSQSRSSQARSAQARSFPARTGR